MRIVRSVEIKICVNSILYGPCIILQYISVIQRDTQYLMINFIHNIQYWKLDWILLGPAYNFPFISYFIF